jgi:hypothetical protein
MSVNVSEKELLDLGIKCADQLLEVLQIVESALAARGSGDRNLIRLCGKLDVKLLELQGKVEDLIQKMHVAEVAY